MGPSVRALLVRLAHKDDYTAEHTRGVALRAVQVGEELGLPPARLRELAIGGLLHDVGTLAVANEILKKPGALNERGVRRDQAASRARQRPGPPARLFGTGGTPRPEPSRAPRRQRLPAGARRA